MSNDANQVGAVSGRPHELHADAISSAKKLLAGGSAWLNAGSGPCEDFRREVVDRNSEQSFPSSTAAVGLGPKCEAKPESHFNSKVKLDWTDRKLLELIAEDSSRSYAVLSQLMNLSAPAVHERVKRLKRDGVVRSVHANLDGCKLGRTLLTFVFVVTENVAATRHLVALAALPEVEEIHSIVGDTAAILKVRSRDTKALEDLLAHIQSIDGVKATRSLIALTTLLERGPSPILLDDLSQGIGSARPQECQTGH